MVKASSSLAGDQGQQLQQLEAMSEQLEAVTQCMKVEQQARVAAETSLAEAREQAAGLLQHLHEMEKARREEAGEKGRTEEELAALRGLLGQIQQENAGLKEANANLLGQCRSLMGRAAPSSSSKRRA